MILHIVMRKTTQNSASFCCMIVVRPLSVSVKRVILISIKIISCHCKDVLIWSPISQHRDGSFSRSLSWSRYHLQLDVINSHDFGRNSILWHVLSIWTMCDKWFRYWRYHHVINSKFFKSCQCIRFHLSHVSFLLSWISVILIIYDVTSTGWIQAITFFWLSINFVQFV